MRQNPETAQDARGEGVPAEARSGASTLRRSILLLLVVGLASAAIVGFTSVLVKRVCARCLVDPADDLAWLRREFRLSDAELGRVRRLHEGYLPKCQELCERIAAKKKELESELAAGQGLTPEAERKLAEVGTLRSQCQAQMLRHFYEVSQAMPPEQGRRYLQEMQRLTLGLHEQFENAMAGQAAPPHAGH